MLSTWNVIHTRARVSNSRQRSRRCMEEKRKIGFISCVISDCVLPGRRATANSALLLKLEKIVSVSLPAYARRCLVSGFGCRCTVVPNPIRSRTAWRFYLFARGPTLICKAYRAFRTRREGITRRPEFRPSVLLKSLPSPLPPSSNWRSFARTWRRETVVGPANVSFHHPSQ